MTPWGGIADPSLYDDGVFNTPSAVELCWPWVQWCTQMHEKDEGLYTSLWAGACSWFQLVSYQVMALPDRIIFQS